MAFAQKSVNDLVHKPVHKDINQVLYESVGTNNHKEVEDIIKDVHIICKKYSNYFTLSYESDKKENILNLLETLKNIYY